MTAVSDPDRMACTVASLADALGVTETTLYRWRSNVVGPDTPWTVKTVAAMRVVAVIGDVLGWDSNVGSALYANANADRLAMLRALAAETNGRKRLVGWDGQRVVSVQKAHRLRESGHGIVYVNLEAARQWARELCDGSDA